ncbi:SH3 domain-containing protein [Clostridium omnivorum]|uniref:SH3b domain-containing protein n=1 Tax=Clostridium omnivorum TaxID=1604902 RepID=A0ABQ5NA00_9CLOT|nr:SH3 domain-containing protein [Clostridium sp. E14]GLC32045.1 hypothetical protein bsdE14_34550 [Clostridium sp. E14]
MKKTKYILLALGFTFTFSFSLFSYKNVYAATQTQISRSSAESRAINMMDLKWTYNRSKNGVPNVNYSSFITQPNQLQNIDSGVITGIPYNWGGQDGLDSHSYSANWSNFLDAVDKGAYIGNVNTEAGYGLIPGTAGIDCSGFVQAVFNINDSKISTSTMFNAYFTKISTSDLKHMDILDRPGDHVVIFDKWGTLNGINGAFTYESTPDQVFGGIQGTKRYFITMDDINNGYVAGRYVNIIEDSATPTQSPNSTTLNSGSYAKVSNVNYYANFRANPTTSSALIGTVPKNTVVYLISSNSGWFQINYNGQIGWIWGNTLSSIPASKYVALNNAYMLNVRTTPDAASTILGTLNQNQYAEVLDSSSNAEWYKISINGIQGWAYKSYLKYIY